MRGRDRLLLLLRRLHRERRRRGRRTQHRAGSGRDVGCHSGAGCADRAPAGPIPPGMKTRDEVLVGLVVTVAIVLTVLGSLWLERRGLSKWNTLFATL